MPGMASSRYHDARDYDPEGEKLVKNLRRPPYGLWFLFLLVLGAAGYGSYWGWNERNRLLAAREASEKARLDLEARVKALESERTGLVSTRDQLLKTVDAKSTELATLKGTYDKLEEQMKDEIAKGEIALTQAGGRLRVDMADKILF